MCDEFFESIIFCMDVCTDISLQFPDIPEERLTAPSLHPVNFIKLMSCGQSREDPADPKPVLAVCPCVDPDQRSVLTHRRSALKHVSCVQQDQRGACSHEPGTQQFSDQLPLSEKSIPPVDGEYP